MGCDIHIRIEVKDEGAWMRVPYVTALWAAYGKENAAQKKWRKEREASIEAAKAEGFIVMPDAFRSRSYDLFGILANVRNGTGFAGVVTGEAWPFIAADRGYPDDMSEWLPPSEEEQDSPGHDYTRTFDALDGDHSQTWISLEELKAFQWDLVTHQSRGIVAWPLWKEWRESGGLHPKEWSGGISGPGIVIISQPQAEAILNDIAEMPAKADRLYVEAFWHETARDATYDWAGKILPILETVAAGRPLRLILSFDS